MKLNMTIELPLKNPEEILDMRKINNIIDTNFVNTLNNEQKFEKFQSQTLDSVSNNAFFLTSVVKKLSIDLESQIVSIVENFNKKILSDLSFPVELLKEHPDVSVQWEAVRSSINVLHDETYFMISILKDLMQTSSDLSELVLEIIKNGYPKLQEQALQIKNLNTKIAENEREYNQQITSIKSEHDIKIEKFRKMNHEKDKRINEKDRKITELQDKIDDLTPRLKICEEFMKEANSQVASKYEDFLEMNKYIGELFKDKNRLLRVLEEKEIVIDQLQHAKEELIKNGHSKNVLNTTSKKETDSFRIGTSVFADQIKQSEKRITEHEANQAKNNDYFTRESQIQNFFRDEKNKSTSKYEINPPNNEFIKKEELEKSSFMNNNKPSINQYVDESTKNNLIRSNIEQNDSQFKKEENTLLNKASRINKDKIDELLKNDTLKKSSANQYIDELKKIDMMKSRLEQSDSNIKPEESKFLQEVSLIYKEKVDDSLRNNVLKRSNANRMSREKLAELKASLIENNNQLQENKSFFKLNQNLSKEPKNENKLEDDHQKNIKESQLAQSNLENNKLASEMSLFYKNLKNSSIKNMTDSGISNKIAQAEVENDKIVESGLPDSQTVKEKKVFYKDKIDQSVKKQEISVLDDSPEFAKLSSSHLMTSFLPTSQQFSQKRDKIDEDISQLYSGKIADLIKEVTKTSQTYSEKYIELPEENEKVLASKNLGQKQTLEEINNKMTDQLDNFSRKKIDNSIKQDDLKK